MPPLPHFPAPTSPAFLLLFVADVPGVMYTLIRLGASVVGVDPTLKAIEAARTHAAIDPLTASIDYRNTVVQELVAAGTSRRDSEGRAGGGPMSEIA